MAIAIVMDFKGTTLDQYDDVINRMGFSPGGAGAPHSMFHWVTKTDDGIRVVDVWDSQEEFDKFAEAQIGPHTQAAGITSPPETTVHELHNHLTGG